MSKDKHPNDEYVNPSSATAPAPVPPETFASAESAGASVESAEERAQDAAQAAAKRK